jgi:methionyl aminopeptidase
MITIKTSAEIELMREANRLLGIVHEELAKAIRPGVSTLELDELAGRLWREMGVESNFKGYEGYPAETCISVNDEIVHGIPSADRILQEGDIVSIDAGCIYKGYNSDGARTHIVGHTSEAVEQLVKVTRESFFAGIAKAKAGNHLYDISNAIAAYVEPYGYGIVRELTGHGIGTDLHEAPTIPNYSMWRRGPKLKPGMTLAIEPMITLGSPGVYWLPDDWTVVTQDGSWAAHYENTILITEGEPEILSLGPAEREAMAHSK